ncbi:MAG TPA: ribbon-helix-helix domain-containing protein [Kurthia gibsonii]|nr:ribbon-helix-helix domain-containing protein [Kurthia gibsonii]
MAEIFKFFNSAPGDERWHYASDFADYFGSVLSSGLISNGEAVGLQVTVNTGTMTTSVNVGKAIIKGYSYENTTPLTLTHSIPEQTLDRIDRIVLRLDLKNASRFIRVFIKEGVSALEPIPPTLQRDQYIFELSLAQVRIRKNTSSIVVSDIKDERADENLCGIVQSLITVPTSVFQQQFDTWFSNYQTTSQSDFTVWFDSIKGQLDGDVGAKLASDLSSHKLDLVSHGIYGVATGTNALVMTDSKVTQYVDGMLVAFKNTTASTASTTLNINSLGAKAILKANGTAVNNLKTNAIYQLRYNGVNFILLGEGGEYGNVTANDVVAGKTFGTENGLQTGSATVASLGGIISSDIALFSAIANENSYAVSEIDKNSGRIAYGRYSTIPPIGCFGDLNGNMISQKSVYTPSYVRLVGWYIDYYVTYLPSSGVITFYNHDDTVIFSFNYIANKGIYGICLYQNTVVIVEYDRTTTTLLTIYKNKTGDTISSFSKIISSDNFYFGDNLKLNLYKIPLIYQYTSFSSSMPHFTTGLIKLNGINTIIHKRFYYDFTEPSLRFLKDYITK